MPITKIQFEPGIDKQNTDISSKGKWTDGDKVRFRYGYPEKMGGIRLESVGFGDSGHHRH